VRRRVGPAAALIGFLVAVPAGPAEAAALFPGCAAPPAGAMTIVVDKVTCQQIDSAAIGGRTAFAYFVPPGCAPARGVRCPVLYLLHGFGGDVRSMLGTANRPSSWVAALDSGPRVNPSRVRDPWNYADPSKWVAKRPLDMVLIAPHGRTVAGGFGPAADLDGYWTDWNPRYARGGQAPRYRTPAPGFGTFIVDELPTFVEARFPVASGRESRAIGGTSLGGFGSFLTALRHPDRYTSTGSVSGAHNFLFGPWFEPPPNLPVLIPGITTLLLGPILQTPVGELLTATVALGDPVSDQAWFRGNNPRDLALNGDAHGANGAQSLFLTAFVNDTIPRQLPGELFDPVGIAFEDIVLPMNLTMQLALKHEHVRSDFAIHQGLHSEPYRAPWLRGMLEKQYARLRHADGSGNPTPPAVRFDYRSVDAAFSVWGWSFAAARPGPELLTLRDVSCRGLTLHGSGRVTVKVPASCHTGRNGSPTFSVDLGPSGLLRARTVTIPLTAL
jgi:pimeloyl-ACP methyl ester carboxylesterase